MILWLPVLGYDYTYHDIDGDLGIDDFSTASVNFDLESAVPFGVQLDEIAGGFTNTPSPEVVTRPGVSAIALGVANGPRRYGWALSREWRGWRREVELEFSETTNQPIALGLPAEPRWLPKLKGSGYPVPSPRPDEVQSGILRKFGQNEPSFNEGVPSFAVGVDGRLWGIGVRGGESGPVDNTLFSILADGSDYRPVAKWVRDRTSPAFWVATSREGLVFAHAPRVVNGVCTFYRYNPTNGEVLDLGPKFSPQWVSANSPLRQLSDGRLYGTTRQGFFRFNVTWMAPDWNRFFSAQAG